MRGWWHGLAPRERSTLFAGAIVVLAILLYTLVWEPYQKAHTRLLQQADAQHETIAWMERAAAEAARLQRVRPGGEGRNESLLALADRSAKQAGLGIGLKRIQPDSTLSVRVWFEQIRFDALIQWLALLDQRYGISIGALQLERQPNSGMVNARVTLQRPEP